MDAHVAGAPVRLVVDGFPSPPGRTMFAKRDWLSRHADHWRRALMLEPRGHSDMSGALLSEPVSPGSHAGLLFMHTDGYAPLSGHAVITVTTIALERGLIMTGGDNASVTFDTPAGTIRAMAILAAGRAGDAGAAGKGKAGEAGDSGETGLVEGVRFVNVPSFVVHAALPVTAGGRKLRVDVAFGGAFYAIVDSEAAGLAVDAAHLPALRRAGMEIANAIEAVQTIAHPLEPLLGGIAGTIFTSPPRADRAALRSVAISASGQAGRSPGGTGTAAVMAVLDAMGLVDSDTVFVHEGLIGTVLTSRIVGRTMVGDHPAIVPEIAGEAWITGEHTFLIDGSDPLAEGFRL